MSSSRVLLQLGKYHVHAWYTTEEFVQDFEEMAVKEDDIVIATCPKSGKSFMLIKKHLYWPYG